MRVRVIVFGLVVVVLAGAGYLVVAGRPTPAGVAGGSGSPSDAVATAGPSAGAGDPALTVTDPHVSVDPSTNLLDGQTVIVRVTGFGIGSQVRVSECASMSSANDQGCGLELAGQTLLFTRESRAGSVAFIVRARASAGPLQTAQVEACANQCVIVATLGAGFAFAATGMTFEAP